MLVILLCASVAAACQSATVPSPAEMGSRESSPDGLPSAGSDPTETVTSSTGQAPRGPGTQSPGSGATGGPSARKDDLAPLGAMCRDYLRAPRIVLEMDWQEGAEPTAEARAHLLDTLRRVSGATVVASGGPEITTEREVWTPADLRAEAAAHRTHYSTSDQMALYVLSVEGRFQDEGALGVAHRASEFAIFPDLIGRLSALLGGRTAVERAVLVHEAGHLLCLVNIGYRSPFDREDAEHPNHSNDRRSVMHWAIETSAIGQLFKGPPPNTFTEQDLADLAGLRAGRL